MFVKSIFDRLAAFAGLVILSPLLLILALLIKIKMPEGPIIYKQQRVGQHGKRFTIYKLRTMVPSVKGSSVSVKGDSRVTPLGAVLRKYKLDVLPELWNVLIGDMSLVGPRPDVPGYADKLEGADREILKLKPGITGPASLKYANEEEILAKQEDPIKYNDEVIYPDKVRINRQYLKHRSFLLDLKFIILTLLRRTPEDPRFR